MKSIVDWLLMIVDEESLVSRGVESGGLGGATPPPHMKSGGGGESMFSPPQ